MVFSTQDQWFITVYQCFKHSQTNAALLECNLLTNVAKTIYETETVFLNIIRNWYYYTWEMESSKPFPLPDAAVRDILQLVLNLTLARSDKEQFVRNLHYKVFSTYPALITVVRHVDVDLWNKFYYDLYDECRDYHLDILTAADYL